MEDREGGLEAVGRRRHRRSANGEDGRTHAKVADVEEEVGDATEGTAPRGQTA